MTDVEKAKMPVVELGVTGSAIELMAKAYLGLTITDIHDKEQFDAVHEARMTVKKTRVKVQKRRKELKADILAIGRKIDGTAEGLFNKMKPIEDHLIKEEKKVTDEQKRLKKEAEDKANKLAAERIDKLSAVDVLLPFEVAKKMADSDFSDMWIAAKKEYDEKLLREKEEEERRKKENEALRLAQEEANRKAKEAEKKLEAMRKKKEAAEAKAKAALKKIEEKKRIEEAKAKAKEEAKAEAEADKKRKEKEEAEAKAELKRQRLLMPDKELLREYAEEIKTLSEKKIALGDDGARLAIASAQGELMEARNTLLLRSEQL